MTSFRRFVSGNHGFKEPRNTRNTRKRSGPSFRSLSRISRISRFKVRSGEIQSAHGPGRGGEFVRLEGHALQHRDEEIRERVIMLCVESKVLSVLKATAREE